MSSIIDAKYKERYRDNPDWLATLIHDQCFVQHTKEVAVKDDEGNDTGKTEVVNAGRPELNLEALFDLAEKNGIAAREKYGDQADKKNAPGRLRMTIGNSLRAAARKRHGLYDVDGNWLDAPADFVGDRPKVQNPDGSKIAKAKPEKEKEAAE